MKRREREIREKRQVAHLQFFICWIDPEGPEQVAEVLCPNEAGVVVVQLCEGLLALEDHVLLQDSLVIAHLVTAGCT